MRSVKMIDITGKEFTFREAEAEGKIFLKRETLDKIRERRTEKGDPLAIAEVAAIQAVKKTSEIIPLCHPIKITSVKINSFISENYLTLSVKVKALEQTGVEMEALTGVLVGLLTIWDVVKKYEKDERGQYPRTMISDVRVKSKVKKAVV